jgi:hypothetical protein
MPLDRRNDAVPSETDPGVVDQASRSGNPADAAHQTSASIKARPAALFCLSLDHYGCQRTCVRRTLLKRSIVLSIASAGFPPGSPRKSACVGETGRIARDPRLSRIATKSNKTQGCLVQRLGRDLGSNSLSENFVPYRVALASGPLSPAEDINTAIVAACQAFAPEADPYAASHPSEQ